MRDCSAAAYSATTSATGLIAVIPSTLLPAWKISRYCRPCREARFSFQIDCSEYSVRIQCLLRRPRNSQRASGPAWVPILLNVRQY